VFPDFYEVEEQQSESISVSAEGFATTALLNITSSTLPMLLERLRLNTQNYRYRVRARTSVGTSDFSNFVIVPNDFSGVPTEPSSVQITPGSITPTSVRVEWLLPAIGKNTNVSFQIRMTPNTTSTVGRRLLQAVTLANGESRRLQALGEGVIQSFEPFSSCMTSGAFFSCAATVTGMRPSFTYLVQLFAQNAIGSSLASDATESPVFVTMLPGPPELPTDFAVIGVGRYHLDFSFRVPRDNGRPIAGYLLDLGRGIPPTGHGIGASLLPGSSSCADVVAAWLAQGGGSQIPRLEGSTLSISATFLPSGVSYNVSLQACNDVGASPYGACACADPICDPHCVSTPLPAHTHAPPDAPDTPTQVQNLNLEFLKPRQLFVTWRQPFDHYSPILETNLTIENTTFLLAGDITAFNVSELSGGRPLTPATQYPATLCMRNAYGYGAGCDATQFLTWLSTTPDVPEAPPRPECDPNANTHTQLYIRQQAATDNGVPVSEYVVNVTNMAGSELFVGTIDPNIGFLIVRSQDVALHLGVPADVVAQQAGNVQNGLLPGTSYKVTTRARNALGWSVSSQVGELCSTRRAPTTPFNWVPIVVALIVTLVLFIAFVIAWRCTDLPKILAPKLRVIVEKEDPLEDFVVKEDNFMEDNDPENRINPVMLAKMQFEKEEAIRLGRKQGRTAAGVPGALKRLNLELKSTAAKEEAPKKVGMNTIDQMLEKRNAKATAKAEGRDPPPAGKLRAAGRKMRVMSVCSKQKEAKAGKMLRERLEHQAQVETVGAKAAAGGRHAAKAGDSQNVDDESALDTYDVRLSQLDTSDTQVREAMEAATEAAEEAKKAGGGRKQKKRASVVLGI